MVDNIHNMPSFSWSQAKDHVVKEVGKALVQIPDVIKRQMIAGTNLLPFSSRGIAYNLIRSPIRLLTVTGAGVVKGKSITEIGKEMKIQMKKDWGGGIADRYTKTLDLKNENHVKMAEANLKYAFYMEMGGNTFTREAQKPEPEEEGVVIREIDVADVQDLPDDLQFLDFENQDEAPILNLKNAEQLPNSDEKPLLNLREEMSKQGDNAGFDFLESVAKKEPEITPYLEAKSKPLRYSTEIRPVINRDECNEIASKIKALGFKEDSDGNYHDKRSGIVFHVFQNKDELVFCFHGLDAKNKLATIEAAAEFLGQVPESTKRAIALGRLCKEIAGSHDLKPVVAGMSHGGGLAQCAAAANSDVKAVVFNSRPMGAGARRYIGQSKVTENAKNITAFSGKGDFLTNSKGLNALAVFTERVLEIPVPGTVGKNYHIPIKAHEKDLLGIHNGIYDQIDDFVLKGKEIK